MKKSVILLVGWLLAFLWIGSADIWAQDAGDYFTIVGMVKDKQNKRTLENVNVSVQGSNIGTVTNAEGRVCSESQERRSAARVGNLSHRLYQ